MLRQQTDCCKFASRDSLASILFSGEKKNTKGLPFDCLGAAEICICQHSYDDSIY